MVPRVLPGKLEQRSGDDGEVGNVVSEEVTEPHKGSDSFHVVGRSRLFDAFSLALPGLIPSGVRVNPK